MVTHRNEWQVTTTIYVAPRNEAGRGEWETCAVAGGLLAPARVRRCGELPAILEIQGGVVERVLKRFVGYAGFRLVARETTSQGILGLVEWTHDPASGLWRMHDKPWTVCDSGRHRPGGPGDLAVAA